jgi:predicted MFS family arabinose efflux permease
MAVAQGIGRFAYTPLLPLMQNGAGLSAAMGGFIASANLAGYLIGALAATAPGFRCIRVRTVRITLACVVVTTGVMVVPSYALWMAARLATGIASGFAFVLGSSIVLDRAARERRPDWVAISYSGVGLGIALSAIAVPVFGAHGGWQAAWLGMAALGAAACAMTLPWLFDDGGGTPSRRDGNTRGPFPRLYWWLLAAYGAQGIGYIIPATFLVAMIAVTPGLTPYAAASWIVVGVVAMPSTVVWSRIGAALGKDKALVIALTVLMIGTVAPLAAPNALGVALAAIALGGSFMGATALANALGHQLAPHRSHVAIGRLTTVFGIGQIIGPAVAGALIGATGSYRLPLIVAGAVLGASALVMACGSLLSAHPAAAREEF